MAVHQPGRLGHARVGLHGRRVAVHELPGGLGRGDIPGPIRQVHRVPTLRVPLELLLPQQVALGNDAGHPALRGEYRHDGDPSPDQDVGHVLERRGRGDRHGVGGHHIPYLIVTHRVLLRSGNLNSVLDCHDSARKELVVGAHIPRPAAEQPAARGLSTRRSGYEQYT